MPAKNEILEELRSLSTVLPITSPVTPYGVPDGYFRDLPDQVLARVGVIREKGLPSLPEGPGKSLPFEVPNGYFEGLAGNILDRIKAGQTAKVYSGEPVTGRSEAAAELALLSPLLSGISRKTPYQVPEGYFDELSPILAGLRERPVYEVPEGYFEELSAQIVSRVQRTPAKVVALGRPGAWWRYSAAAVVAAFVLTLGWLRLHKTPGVNTGTTDIANLNKVSDQEIESYLDLDNHSVPLAETISNSTATLDIDDSDIKSLLGDVPDAELRQYLEDQAGAKDIVTN